jgi:predicted MFS family arabinose efflux permease
MVAGTGLLALPCLGYALVDSRSGIAVLTALRGAGFGLFTVVGSLLVTQVVPPQSRGRAIGLYGAIAAAAGTALPGLGLLLAHDIAVRTVFVLAVVVGWLPALSAMLSWRRPPEFAPPPPRMRGRVGELARALTPSVVLFVPAGIAFGTVYTFPLGDSSESAAALVITFGCAFALARMAAGILADRIPGIHGLLLASNLLAAAGMLGLASGRLLYPAAVACGLGVGGLCTGSLVHMLNVSAQEGLAFGASLWNVTYDSGIALGGLVMGVVVSSLGDHAAFLIGGLLLAGLGLPACYWSRRMPESNQAGLTAETAAP